MCFSVPFIRMELTALPHTSDDRSDSGVSSLHASSCSSWDERSGSRSSALSCTEEPHCANQILLYNPSSSDLSVTSAASICKRRTPPEPVHVWRDPSLLVARPSVCHINSIQHQSLLMSHSSSPTSAATPASSPVTHTPLVSQVHHVTPPPLLPTHSLQHLPPPGPYSLLPDMIWKHQYAAHPLAAQHSIPAVDRGLQKRLFREHREVEVREIENQHKEREKLERERQELDKQMERERGGHERIEREQEQERQEKQRAAEQAVHKHFEESLRLAQHKHNMTSRWSIINSLPPPPEEALKRTEQDAVYQQQVIASERVRREPPERAFFPTGTPRLASASKAEYPPPAHSQANNGGKPTSSEKSVGHTTLPKAEPKLFANLHGYPAYQPAGFITHDGTKVKQEQSKASLASSVSLSVSKSTLNLERDREFLPNLPLVSSDVKSSVIVKNERQSPQHLESLKLPVAHSPSPKHQILPPHQLHFHKTGGYDLQPRPHLGPSQLPHHLTAHQMATEAYRMAMEAQNMVGKVHGQQQQQQLSSHSQRQLPLPGTAEQRFKATTMSTYTYPMPSILYSPSPGAGTTKPKVSSPAPGHFYGKPMAGIASGTPVCRSDIINPSPLPLTTKPSQSYQTLSHPHPPPPAHRTSLVYDPRLYPSKLQGASPPTCRTPSHPPACQTQPLDLGVSNIRDDHTVSLKRKGGASSSVLPSDHGKRQRCDVPGSLMSLPHGLGHPLTQSSSSLPSAVQPLLSRVGEPSSVIANAATAITTVVNTAAYCSPMQMLSTSLATDTPVADRPPSRDDRPSSAGSISSAQQRQSPANLTTQSFGSPVPVVTCSSPLVEETSTPPFTPIKTSSVDSDKSNSPGPMRTPTNYPVHKLKKAWLQRHSGEDGAEDASSGIVGAGSCVTLPITLFSACAGFSFSKDRVNSSSDSITNSVQSELGVGGVGKSRQFSAGNTVNDKVSPVVLSTKGNFGVFLNGHERPSSKPSVDDSSSSDSDLELKKTAKRKPPKVKRKRGNGGAIRKAVAEEVKRKRLAAMAESDSSGSDKESATDKDSDSGASKKAANSKEPRKRGRRPKGPKFQCSSEPRQKKTQGQLPTLLRDPFLKPSISQLKKTGESFLQDGACFEVAPKLAKCRECRWTPNQRSKNTPNIFCRFYAFRRLRYTKNSQLAIAGFSDPHKDAAEEDLRLWLPFPDSQPADLDLEVSRFILMQVGDQFCDLLQQESACPEIHMSDDKTIAWKRVVQGVREMCDVCETTLFNFHWACGKCGFVVCIDCYKGRKNGTVKVWGDSDKEGKDEFLWLLCTNRQIHEQEKLMLTQIIAGDSLLRLGTRSHEVRSLWGIPQYCACDVSKTMPSKGLKGVAKDLLKNLVKAESLNGLLKLKEENITSNSTTKQEDKNSLSWLADVALCNEEKMSHESGSSSDTDSEDKEGNYSTLRELLIRPSHKPGSSRSSSPANSLSPRDTDTKGVCKKSRLATLDEVISSVIEHSVQRQEDAPSDTKKPTPELKHFVRRYNWCQKDREPLPIRIMTHTESKILYPDLPHVWLCDGKLLRLTDPKHPGNGQIFGDQWRRGQPVLVSDVSQLLDSSLWHPDSFARDFGDDKNDLVNCMTGNLVPNQPMRKFWEGFEHFSRRLKDEHGNAMLLKLKDWPPGEDFAEMLPSRFADLMRVLPMPEYTNRTGHLNLASRLPDCFVRPDLGPKMYNAYGSALHPTKGTTNLHLDISDAVNVMVYVGIPKDTDSDEHIKEAFRAIDEAGCDILTRRRVRDKGELPGALWHIYHSRDADKIRDLLNKVSLERGNRLEPHHDPIHDQSWYLDSHLRERLYKEYSVEGYAIVQCLGDAVFIPAGAPHQVRNLHNCIKVAEDFVSPENVSHCFHLTQEFRELSNDHTNHEDKLQIKNIIYHAVKDSLAVLSKYTGGELKEKALASLLENGTSLNSSDNSNEQTADNTEIGNADVPTTNIPIPKIE